MGGVNLSGIVKDAALNLGPGAVPQLSHLLRDAYSVAQREENLPFSWTNT